MTDLVTTREEHAHREDRGELASTPFSIPVRLFGHDRFVELRPGQRLEHLLEIVARDGGLVIEELIILRDGEAEPIHRGSMIDHNYPHRHRHHVHRRHPVTVTVHYQAGSHHREFRRDAALEQVLDWAVGAFGIDATMAAEFELALAGQTEELPLSEHLGHLAGKQDALALNLVRGVIANGADHD